MVGKGVLRRSPSYKGLRPAGVIPLTSSGSYGSLASGAPSPPPGRGGGGGGARGSCCRTALFYLSVFGCGCLLTAWVLSFASPGGGAGGVTGGGAGDLGAGLEQSIVASSLRTASAKRGLLIGAGAGGGAGALAGECPSSLPSSPHWFCKRAALDKSAPLISAPDAPSQLVH